MLLLRTSRGVDPGIPLLRSLGSNAHVWLPGANGVSVASLPSNNYLLSDGSTGYSGVDAVDGLTLDALNGGASTQTARFTAAVSEHFYTVKGANTLLAGDIEIICQAALTNWQTANQAFASSDNLAGNYGFLFYIDASGNPVFRYSPDGTAVRTATCSAKFSTVFSASANGYVRVTYNSTTGDTKFYTSPDGTTWTQLGTTQVITAGTVFSGTGGIAVGAQFSGTTIAIAGSITRLRVYRDLVGTIAVDFNPASYMLGSTSWVSAVGETWTFGGSTISTILPSGTHLTQPTTANKPLVRRGMFNLLRQSQALATTPWAARTGTIVATNNFAVGLDGTTTATKLDKTGVVDASWQQGTDTVMSASTPYTAVFILQKSVTTKIAEVAIRTMLGGIDYSSYVSFDTLSGATYVRSDTGTPAVTVSVADASTYWVIALNKTSASGASVDSNIIIRPYIGTTLGGFDDTATGSCVVWRAGLFPGTWTAAQILAEGGIPTTTATAASNPSAGKYWWSFDGSNDSLLSGNLGITNACTIVIAGRVDNLAISTALLDQDTNGASIYVITTGAVRLNKSNISTLVESAAATIVAGVPFVITVRLSGGTAVIRLNGVQIATAATALSFSATTGAQIGAFFGGASNFINGALGWVVPLPVALSDADCLTVERLVGSQFPGMVTF